MEKIKVSEPFVDKKELKALEEVLFSGLYVSGKKVEEFEQQFSRYCETSYGIGANSGTAALHISLASFDIGPGDEVIIPALTFFSTATSVIHQNAIPIFADIDEYSMNISPDDINEKITEKTKAIIPVHLFGNPAKMDEINEIAIDNELIVIEDCAQAHGAEYKGNKVGSLGNCGCFSFFATKNMTTGEGGIITTNDKKVHDIGKIIRNHGMVDRDTHEILGYNYRMNEFSAAMGIIQLAKLDFFNNKRIYNSNYIYNKIKNINWIKIPKIESYSKSVFFWCPIIIDEVKLGMSTIELRNKLLNVGIETRHRYNAPLNLQKMLINNKAYPMGCPFTCPFYNKNVNYSGQNFPNAKKISGKILGLPNHPKLEIAQIDRIIKELKNI